MNTDRHILQDIDRPPTGPFFNTTISLEKILCCVFITFAAKIVFEVRFYKIGKIYLKRRYFLEQSGVQKMDKVGGL